MTLRRSSLGAAWIAALAALLGAALLGAPPAIAAPPGDPEVALESATVEQSDIDRLLEEGFSEEDVWDIGAIAAFFAMSNRMANLSGMRPNDEFYAMGR